MCTGTLLLTLLAANAAYEDGSGTPPSFQVAQDCQQDHVLVPSGQQVGYCIPGSDVKSPIDVVNPPSPGWPGTGHGAYLSLRIGGKGYVSEHKELKMCELGYYCPFNETTDMYDLKIPCPDKHFCWTGSIEPTSCSGFNKCEGNAMRAGAGGLVLFVFLALILVGICICSAIRDAAAIKLSQQARDDFDGDSVETFGSQFKFDIKPVSIEFRNMGSERPAALTLICETLCPTDQTAPARMRLRSWWPRGTPP